MATWHQVWGAENLSNPGCYLPLKDRSKCGSAIFMRQRLSIMDLFENVELASLEQGLAGKLDIK